MVCDGGLVRGEGCVCGVTEREKNAMTRIAMLIFCVGAPLLGVRTTRLCPAEEANWPVVAFDVDTAVHRPTTFGADAHQRVVLVARKAEADSVEPAELRTYSTLHSIGVEWDVRGDANHNAKCEVRYRVAGSERWRKALDLFRIDYYGWYGETKADRAYNMLAGSILFLEPGTAYEVQLALADADGGNQTRTVHVKTRPIPVLAYQPQPDWRTDVDYDGFDWDETPTPFWWQVTPGKGRQFRDLETFARAVAIERHGIRLHKEEVFEIQDIPGYAAEPYSARRLTLKPGCAAVDASQPLPNLCDDFVGAAPDLGAYERGKPEPHYGPRPRNAKER
jgi:hypothetical protein